MTQKEIRNIVSKVFDEVYGTYGVEEDGVCYTLQEIKVENSQQVNYIIANTINGVIVDFWVSGFGVFDAKSNQYLLSSKYEVNDWLSFIIKTEIALNQFREEEENSGEK